MHRTSGTSHCVECTFHLLVLSKSVLTFFLLFDEFYNVPLIFQELFGRHGTQEGCERIRSSRSKRNEETCEFRSLFAQRRKTRPNLSLWRGSCGRLVVAILVVMVIFPTFYWIHDTFGVLSWHTPANTTKLATKLLHHWTFASWHLLSDLVDNTGRWEAPLSGFARNRIFVTFEPKWPKSWTRFNSSCNCSCISQEEKRIIRELRSCHALKRKPWPRFYLGYICRLKTWWHTNESYVHLNRSVSQSSIPSSQVCPWIFSPIWVL